MGRKILKFFQRVGDAVLGTVTLQQKTRAFFLRLGKRKRELKIPEFLQGYFEKRHAGVPEYVMFKAQIAILIIFFLTALLFFLTALHILPPGEQWWLFIPVIAIASGYLLWLTPTQVKMAFGQDYPAYRSFLLMCVAVAWVFLIALRYSPVTPSLENLYLALVPPFIAIGFVVVAFAIFRFRYGRNFTYGIVEQVRGGKVAVRVGYDICSNVKSGIYVVDSFIKVRKGERVKLSVDRAILGLRGSKVRAIIGRS